MQNGSNWLEIRDPASGAMLWLPNRLLAEDSNIVSSPDVTALLGDWSRGNRTALTELLPLVYAELRRVAARQLRRERVDHTLQPTALSPSTAKRDWRTAKAWLTRELGPDVRS